MVVVFVWWCLGYFWSIKSRYIHAVIIFISSEINHVWIFRFVSALFVLGKSWVQFFSSKNCLINFVETFTGFHSSKHFIISFEQSLIAQGINGSHAVILSKFLKFTEFILCQHFFHVYLFRPLFFELRYWRINDESSLRESLLIRTEVISWKIPKVRLLSYFFFISLRMQFTWCHSSFSSDLWHLSLSKLLIILEMLTLV